VDVHLFFTQFLARLQKVKIMLVKFTNQKNDFLFLQKFHVDELNIFAQFSQQVSLFAQNIKLNV
jgi:hypothetical protein